MGFFDRLKKGLTKSRNQLSEHMDELFGAGRPIDDDFYEELTDILVEGDIGAKTAFTIVDELEGICRDKKIRRRTGNR